MELCHYLPFFQALPPAEQSALSHAAVRRRVPQGTLLHNGSADCLGLLVIELGQLRAYMTSDEGREITLYRLFDRDICLFSASCMLSSIQFDIIICAEKETAFWMIPADFYKRLMERSVAVSNYTNQLMASRFTEVMWLVEQILWKSFDQRLARFLVEESALEQTSLLIMTHEKIAAHLGTAREVVTRMLKYFQSEGMVRLTRGAIELLDLKRLEILAQI
ncbi:Crp/Fnr family transcriptional regulator [Pusillibacter faecalis]|uniref:Crp/Fnr family transcriptional regulator n=1 Tax=Pusillibacter faecalis TaxID=2714358 RepID=UPI002941EAB1|nr:Crp/Fnr family transcriptional regulator [Pusillibacter faecalis]